MWEAVRTPCCNTAFCEECITTHLLEHDFECAMCESKIASLDKLQSDMELREKVKGYVDGVIERSKKDAAAEGEQATKDEKDKDAKDADAAHDSGEGDAPNEAKEGDGTDDSVKTEPNVAAAPGPEGQAQASHQSGPSAATTPALDPVKMQEMLNPQNMQLYMAQVCLGPSGDLHHAFR